MAKVCLNKDSKEYYMASNHQVTIFIPDESKPDMLSQEGVKLFEVIKSKITNGEFSKVIVDYLPLYTESGMWINDIKSKYYVDNKDKIVASLHSFDNVKIYGIVKDTQDIIVTSEVLMYTTNWCYTTGEKLYKLENKLKI